MADLSKWAKANTGAFTFGAKESTLEITFKRTICDVVDGVGVYTGEVLVTTLRAGQPETRRGWREFDSSIAGKPCKSGDAPRLPPAA